MRTNNVFTIGITITILLSAAPLTAFTLNYDNATNTYTVTFTLDDFIFSKFNTYDTIHLKDGGILTEPGKPILPLKNIYIAIPTDQTIQSVHLIDITTETLPKTYTILPTQPPKRLSTNNSEPIFHHPTPSYYQTTYHPPQWITQERQFTHTGQNLLHLTLYPIRYNPHTKQLTYASQITFKLQTIIDTSHQEYLPTTLSSPLQKMYQTQIEELVLNPEDVTLQTTSHQTEPVGVPPGSYDYVIITPDNFSIAFQPLAHWKTQKGVPATIMNLSWIYNSGGYSGTDKQKIRAFIQDAHTTWGTNYYLLGADTNNIPYHQVYYEGDWIPTDVYFGDYDDDWTYEVMIGRASVISTGSTTGGVENFVNKILTYEKNPPTTNYTKQVGLFGFDLDFITDGEDCKIDIDNLYIPTDWSVSTVYDSHSGNHEDNVDITVNAGQHFINHIDHSNEYYMGTGSTNHDWGLTTSEVDAFINGNKQSIWYSIGCWASAFDYDNCIAEHLVRDTDGGGVAYIGNTRYGWYYQGNDDYASLRYDRYFFRSLFNQNHYVLGDLFIDHKHDAYNSLQQNDLNKYIFSEINLLGDPEMPLWTDNPTSLTVTHPTTIPINESFFTVQVTSGGSDIQDATVCLWKENDIYQTSTTNTIGQATFTLTLTTPGQILVTVTKHNYLPFEGNATVLSNNQPPIAEAGGPYTGEAGQPLQLNGSISYDPDGIIILYEWDYNDDGTYDWNSSTTGTTNYTYTSNGIYTARLRVTDNDSAQANDTATVNISSPANNPPNLPNNPIPSNEEIDVVINPILSWIGGDPDGDPVCYDVYFGKTSPPPKKIANQTTTNYFPSSLEHLTPYYWQIVSWDSHGTLTEGPLWQFTTMAENNIQPNAPSITGSTKGRAGVTYSYTFTCTDPNSDNISLFVDWGDGNDSGWLGPYNSGEVIYLDHTWEQIESYIIKAKGKDIHAAEGEWGQLSITMPLHSYLAHPILQFLRTIIERFPRLNVLISILLN